jgi:serine/threonine protein phosphatase 1
MSFFGKLSRRFIADDARGPKGAKGARAYAIGDVHGRLDLLETLLRRIKGDIAARGGGKRNYIIFLGDYVDRGPSSAQVMETLRSYRPAGIETVFLAGNHEEVLLRLLKGERNILASWLKFGGSECAESYGIDIDALRSLDERSALDLLARSVPSAHVRFLESLADTFSFGDYLFVHAGIRPGIPIEQQDRTDLRWIREPFLSDTKEHGFIVVHGHTIVDQVDDRSNRIGIDTGAYRSGILTAVGVEGSERWYLTSNSADIEQSEAAQRFSRVA